jgi:hypothetical protein
LSAVLRMVGVVASTAGNEDLDQKQWLGCLDSETHYPIMRFFGGSNRENGRWRVLK